MNIAFEYEDDEGVIGVEKIAGLTSEQTKDVFVELLRAANENWPPEKIAAMKDRIIRAFKLINKLPRLPNTFYAPSLELVYRKIGFDAKLSAKECADSMLALTARGMVRLTELQMGIVQVVLIDPDRFISPEARALMRQMGTQDVIKVFTAPVERS